MALPAHAGELCFSTEVFLERDFNVDEFVSGCRRRVTIEHLRDDLEGYYRTLKSAMVELINKDYADFVNLSANLVGMDKSIDSLTVPLSQLQEEIMSIKSAIEATVDALDGKLALRAEIRKRKAMLQRLVEVMESVEKLERLLKLRKLSPKEAEVMYGNPLMQAEEFSAVVMERISSEFNKLQYNVSLAGDHQMVEEVKPRIALITATLQNSLERWFQASLEGAHRDTLTRCLLSYASIGRQQAAETMFQSTVVHPFMEKVISTKALLTHPQGLSGVYAEVLRFVPRHCSLLLEVTQPRPSSLSRRGDISSGVGAGEGGGHASGFDFLVNAVWPEVVLTVDEKVSMIFAPGNPDTFHRNYVASMEFVSSFEALCPSQSSVRRLRAHPSFTAFMSKWSLPIYFQIRFQEIAGALETKLSLPLAEAKESSFFKLELFSVLWSCLHQCWRDGVFLPALVHRFWKLSLQLIMRCASWLSELSAATQEPEGKRSATATPPLSVNQCLLLIQDCQQLIDQLLLLEGLQFGPSPECSLLYIRTQFSVFYGETIKSKIPVQAVKSMTVLEGGLEQAKEEMRRLVPTYESYVVREVSQQCSQNLETAQTIPRLFRRTNREAPQKASKYVSSVLKPVLAMSSSKALPQVFYDKWCLRIVQAVSERYLAIASDLLVSVKRTEDSLLKLTRSRKSVIPTSSGGMSDDNKIRLQIALDIEEFASQVSQLKLSSTDIPPFSQLMELGQTAKTTALSTPLPQ